MPTESHVSVLILIPTLRYAEKHGILPSRLLQEVGLVESDLEAAGNRIPFAKFATLTQRAAEYTGDPYLGLHLAEYMSAGALGILGFVLMNCQTLNDALNKYVKYQRMTGEGIQTTVNRQNQRVTISFTIQKNGIDPGHPSSALDLAHRHLMEGMLSSFIAMMGALIGRDGNSGQGIRPSEVTFTGEAPADETEYKRIFQCPIQFKKTENTLIFPEAILELRIVQPNRELLALFEKHTLEYLEKMEAKLIHTRKVAEECARLFNGDPPSIEAVAQKLSMSSRNLQLKLRQEGTSYRETLDRVRKDIAMGHLKNRQVTVAEVAYLLGFSEPSVFHRSFKRWTGYTPGDFRQNAMLS